MNSNKKIPTWFWIVGIAGLAWNIFGVAQFVQSVVATKESLIGMGMTEAQAQLMTSYPLWMTLAFAVGTFGGVLGCLLLLARKGPVTQVFLTSLVAYIVLFIGDITEGVFAALGAQQVIILSSVIFIAAALLYFSVWTRKKLTY